MGRPLRIEYPGALYHIISRGNERRSIFLDNADRFKFLAILKDYHERYNVLIHSFVLMDNHYHLILETPKANLVEVMHGINGVYTGYFNRRHVRCGHLFQGRYKGILVDKDAYLVELSRYVHLNPVRAEIVEKPQYYTWSSYTSYIGKEKEHPWIEYSWVLGQFDKDKDIARKKYRKYIEESVHKDNLAQELSGQIILGGERFIEKIMDMFKGKSISKEIVERELISKNIMPEDIIKKVTEAFEVTRDFIDNRAEKSNSVRKAAMYLVYKYCNMGNREAGKIFGGIHYSAIRKAYVRFEEELATDKELAKTIRKIESNVKT